MIKRGKWMKKLDVRDLDSSEYKLWDNLVEESLHGTLFHTTDWLKMSGDPKCSYHQHLYGCFKEGELIGGCSFLSKRFRSFNIGSTAFNITPYGGFVIKDLYDQNKTHEMESFQTSVVQSILAYMGSKKIDGAFIANPPEFVDVRPFTHEDWTANVKYTYYFDLTKNIEDTISKTVKNNIKKALRNGVQIYNECSAQVFYDLWKDTYNKHGLKPPVPFRFIEHVLDTLHNTGKADMWVARMPSGEAASAEIVVWDSKRAYLWVAASNRAFKSSAASTLLTYNILKELKDRNFKELNMMTANVPHLASYMSAFNPKLAPYYVLSKNNTKYGFYRSICKIFD